MINTETSSSVESRLSGAILAAGRGSRMNGRYDWLPKTLLPVGGRPILAHQLRLLRSLGVRRVVVLVGHLGDRIVDYVDTTCPSGLDVEFVQQTALNGAGHGLLCLRPRLPGPFVLFLGDIFLLPARLEDLAAPILRRECAAVLAVTEESDPVALGKNFSVHLDLSGRVLRVVEKPAASGPALKGCGAYALTPAIFEAIERTAVNERGEIGITESIQTLITLGHDVRTARVSAWDMNVTTAEDLDACTRRLIQLAPAPGVS